MGAPDAHRAAAVIDRMMMAIYGALIEIVVWTALVPFELWRIARRRSTWSELRARLGSRATIDARAVSQPRPRILIHAVSMGETVAARACAESLRAACGDAEIVLSTGVPAVAALTGHVLLPWDRRRAMRTWLRRLVPDAVIVIETEIWPGLFDACRTLAIPLFILNGRIAPADARRYRLARRFFARVLAIPAAIAAQTEAHAARFVAIGAPADRVVVTGNMKFDARPAPASGVAPPGSWQDAFVIVAGSTHAPEERMLVKAFRELRRTAPRARLVLAPRHVERAAALRRDLASTMTTSASEAEAASEHEHGHEHEHELVIVEDRLGTLSAWYAHASVAIVGGSFAACGGHNPIEPARHACPIVVGRHTEDVDDLVAPLEAGGGLFRAPAAPAARGPRGSRGMLTMEDTSDLVALLQAFERDDAWRRSCGEAARAAALAQTGAANRNAALVLGRIMKAGTKAGTKS